MNRTQLEHLIRAAASITQVKEIVVLGSQSILAQFPDAPGELLVSMEADLFPRGRPDLADLIEGTLGELSPFHETFGYYAEGTDPGVATLPRGWEERLVPLRSPALQGATGLCLEVHDLLIAKLVAGREKDRDYARVCATRRLVDRSTLLARLAATELDPDARQMVEARIAAAFRTE